MKLLKLNLSFFLLIFFFSQIICESIVSDPAPSSLNSNKKKLDQVIKKIKKLRRRKSTTESLLEPNNLSFQQWQAPAAGSSSTPSTTTQNTIIGQQQLNSEASISNNENSVKWFYPKGPPSTSSFSFDHYYPIQHHQQYSTVSPVHQSSTNVPIQPNYYMNSAYNNYLSSKYNNNNNNQHKNQKLDSEQQQYFYRGDYQQNFEANRPENQAENNAVIPPEYMAYLYGQNQYLDHYNTLKNKDYEESSSSSSESGIFSKIFSLFSFKSIKNLLPSFNLFGGHDTHGSSGYSYGESQSGGRKGGIFSRALDRINGLLDKITSMGESQGGEASGANFDGLLTSNGIDDRLFFPPAPGPQNTGLVPALKYGAFSIGRSMAESDQCVERTTCEFWNRVTSYSSMLPCEMFADVGNSLMLGMENSRFSVVNRVARSIQASMDGSDCLEFECSPSLDKLQRMLPNPSSMFSYFRKGDGGDEQRRKQRKDDEN